MSRLDTEYDPVAHHDLDRIEEAPLGEQAGFTAVCACGWVGRRGYLARGDAFTAWDQHRHREWFG